MPIYSKRILKKTDYIINDNQHPTGTALIFVADSGENCIAVAPGANYSLSPESINHFSKVIDETEIVVMQAEIPYNTIKSIALLAQQKGKKVLFNPAPACLIDAELMKAIDILVVNEVEAAFVSGIKHTGDNLEEIAEALITAGAQNVVITLGSHGVYMKNAYTSGRLPSYKVNAIDTIAAGDTFCGALAVMCAQKEIDIEALKFANAAAAIAVTRSGAQPSIPTLEEVNHFILKNELPYRSTSKFNEHENLLEPTIHSIR